MRAQKLQDEQAGVEVHNGDTNKKKRKASSDDEDTGTIRKRTKATNGIPEGFFDPGTEPVPDSMIVPSPGNEIRIPSRPATPSKPVEALHKQPEVDEDEWAAFEADIATAEANTNTFDEAVISAPAMSAAELATKEKEDENKRRREQQEADQEGDKEEQQRKLEDEFEEMESLEQRVRKLREKREALRLQKAVPVVSVVEQNELDENDDDDEEDDWDVFGRR